MKYYKYNNQLGKVTQSYLSVCFQMHKLQKFNNVCICITHHPLLLCRIPRGSQGYSSPNLGASSVRSTRKSSLRDKKVTGKIFLTDSCECRRVSSALPSSVHGGGSGSDTDSGVGAHWRSAGRSTVRKHRLWYRTQETERRAPISGRNAIKYSWGTTQPVRMCSWECWERR